MQAQIKENIKASRHWPLCGQFTGNRWFPCIKALGATARSYRRQDGANAAARFEKFLPARASLRPPISLKFST